MIDAVRALDRMTRRSFAAIVVFVLIASVLASACRGAFSRKYEYEEEVYLDLNGSATVYVNASVPALVALRGLDLPLDPAARLDRRNIRRMFETPVTRVENVSLSRRDNRRYVHLRLDVADIRQLSRAAPFAWSAYGLQRGAGEDVTFLQTVGSAVNHDVGDTGWTGRERVAFRLHLPSRVLWHNSPSREVERGNIIAWEQPLAARLRGEPVGIEVRMAAQSILSNALTLFGLTILLAGVTFAAVVWLVMRRGADNPGLAQ
jgi:hypothetical protein